MEKFEKVKLSMVEVVGIHNSFSIFVANFVCARCLLTDI